MYLLPVLALDPSAPPTAKLSRQARDIRLNVPTAPEVGLHLDECMFASYNSKWMDTHEAVSIEPYARRLKSSRSSTSFLILLQWNTRRGCSTLVALIEQQELSNFRYMETAGSEAKVRAEVENMEESANAKH
ncbi:hypothetical protein ZWY2020_021524 [Hordeum vulgare]|nr:hypothetical protein ZWY2020_021524 [Hordeum vulgare]